jgi:hypothetical protein
MALRTSVLAAAGLVTGGCATGGMIPGTIYSSGGKILQFEIEKARRNGAVKAVDPSTGERFSGTYVGILEAVSGSSTAFVSGQGRYASGFASGSVGSNIANATAYLKGDKGTMLTCRMQIEAGISPHGIGDCTDNRAGKYKLQF